MFTVESPCRRGTPGFNAASRPSHARATARASRSRFSMPSGSSRSGWARIATSSAMPMHAAASWIRWGTPHADGSGGIAAAAIVATPPPGRVAVVSRVRRAMTAASRTGGPCDSKVASSRSKRSESPAIPLPTARRTPGSRVRLLHPSVVASTYQPPHRSHRSRSRIGTSSVGTNETRCSRSVPSRAMRSMASNAGPSMSPFVTASTQARRVVATASDNSRVRPPMSSIVGASGSRSRDSKSTISYRSSSPVIRSIQASVRSRSRGLFSILPRDATRRSAFRVAAGCMLARPTAIASRRRTARSVRAAVRIATTSSSRRLGDAGASDVSSVRCSCCRAVRDRTIASRRTERNVDVASGDSSPRASCRQSRTSATRPQVATDTGSSASNGVVASTRSSIFTSNAAAWTRCASSIVITRASIGEVCAFLVAGRSVWMLSDSIGHRLCSGRPVNTLKTSRKGARIVASVPSRPSTVPVSDRRRRSRPVRLNASRRSIAATRSVSGSTRGGSPTRGAGPGEGSEESVDRSHGGVEPDRVESGEGAGISAFPPQHGELDGDPSNAATGVVDDALIGSRRWRGRQFA